MPTVYGERWETVKSLGQGGQGHTFLVTDKKGGAETQYVLKRLINKKRLGRFKREIEVVRSLSHENIVQLVDFDLDAERPYLVMEYCIGGSLEDVQPFWRESPIQTLKLFQQICEGVCYAHHQGVIHRDLKPANIFLRTPTGPAVVGDFGICHIEDDGTRLTLTEEAAGPWLYMAPELEDGRVGEISKKSDTYSLGKLLYWMLSGRVFSREKHRDLKWDLKGADDIVGWENPYMEHVNHLLDYMIVADIEQRRHIDAILLLLKRTIRLVEKEFNPIGRGIPQRCYYCGHGQYVSRVAGRDTGNFGLGEPVNNADWRMFVCDICGHVQIFRVDMAQRKEWWQ
jgi:serine/threonine protein kinase